MEKEELPAALVRDKTARPLFVVFDSKRIHIQGLRDEAPRGSSPRAIP